MSKLGAMNLVEIEIANAFIGAACVTVGSGLPMDAVLRGLQGALDTMEAKQGDTAWIREQAAKMAPVGGTVQ